MRVLITGADGFIGSHLTEALYSEGHQIRALCQYNSFNNWGWLEDISCKNDIEIFSGDIRDPYYCEELVSGVDIATIIEINPIYFDLNKSNKIGV